MNVGESMNEKKYLIEEETDLTVNNNQREARINSLSLRTDNELFDEASYQFQPAVNVRFRSNRKGEGWQVMRTFSQEGKRKEQILLKIPSERLAKSEREFLKTPQGMLWFLKVAREGIESVSHLKRLLAKR